MEHGAQKVLIGIPSYPGHAYCKDEFVANTRDLIRSSSARVDALLAWNGQRPSRGFPSDWKRWTYKRSVGDRGVDILLAKQRYIREYALEHGYTHVFLLESDTLPPPDTIDRFLAHAVDLVSALYFIRHEETVRFPQEKIRPYLEQNPRWKELYPEIYEDTLLACDVMLMQQKVAPAVWGMFKDVSRMWNLSDAFPQRGLVRVLSAGIGSVLVTREVLEQVDFRLRTEENPNKTQQFTDFLFFRDAYRKGFEAFVDTDCIAEHLHVDDFHDGTMQKWFEAPTSEKTHKPDEMGYKMDEALTTHQRNL